MKVVYTFNTEIVKGNKFLILSCHAGCHKNELPFWIIGMSFHVCSVWVLLCCHCFFDAENTWNTIKILIKDGRNKMKHTGTTCKNQKCSFCQTKLNTLTIKSTFYFLFCLIDYWHSDPWFWQMESCPFIRLSRILLPVKATFCFSFILTESCHFVRQKSGLSDWVPLVHCTKQNAFIIQKIISFFILSARITLFCQTEALFC